jgi:NADH:ubiquinone oxidoreductase subunit 6 (subunit J)
MSLVTIIFYFFMTLAACSATAILFIKNIFKGALLLLVCLLSLAALYIVAFAEFVAVTQIMVYAGGIVVVIIFGIMLTSKISGKPLMVNNANIFSGLLAGGLVLFFLCKLFSTNTFGSSKITSTENAVTETGMQLLTSYVLPFEIAGILLLIALLGAAVVTSSIIKPNKH